MTRKDYIRLAAALSRARTTYERPNWNNAIDAAAREIADELNEDSGFDRNGNRRFDRERFLKAAGNQ